MATIGIKVDSKTMNYFEMDKIDEIGRVSDYKVFPLTGSALIALEFVLRDSNLWDSQNEEQHLMQLQQKINNYIYYIKTEQYRKLYSNYCDNGKFPAKIIRIVFKYEPSEKGYIFLGQVNKSLQDTDIFLRIIFPQENEFELSFPVKKDVEISCLDEKGKILDIDTSVNKEVL